MAETGIKIKPRMKDPQSRNPTKLEILNGMKDLPGFEKLDERHWSAIYASWDVAAETGKPASVKAIAAAAGVAPSTIKQWRCREDFLRAQEMVKIEVLHEWAPALVNRALKMALAGDKQMLKLFMENFILPNKKGEDDTPDTEINISWGAPEPKEVIDVVPNASE